MKRLTIGAVAGIILATVLVPVLGQICTVLPVREPFFVGAHIGTALAQEPLNSYWYASTGMYPDEVCWELLDTAEPETPQLAGNILTLGTDANEELLCYRVTETNLSIPDPLIIEGRMRWVTGGHEAGQGRRGAAFLFRFGFRLNALFISQDQVHLLSDVGVQGPTAFVDTDDVFHTYRIEVTGESSIEVFQDGIPILSGSTYILVAPPVIAFGDITEHAFGTSEWTYVAHNAGAEPCGGPVSTERRSWGRIKVMYTR